MSVSMQLAKATLLRLSQGRLDPTPENYARAWLEAGGSISAMPSAPDVSQGHWQQLAGHCAKTLRIALPPDDERAAALSRELGAQAERWHEHGADPALAAAVDETCQQARTLFMQRHHLVDELGKLVRALGEGLTELAEDQSWAQGQAEALRANLEGGALSVRGVRAAADMLTQTRSRPWCTPCRPNSNPWAGRPAASAKSWSAAPKTSSTPIRASRWAACCTRC
jgi:hypothetical protein